MGSTNSIVILKSEKIGEGPEKKCIARLMNKIPIISIYEKQSGISILLYLYDYVLKIKAF
jgi:hypothetical protein